jgi:hypothetical protein
LSLAKRKLKELTNSEQSKYCRVSIFVKGARAARFNGTDPGGDDRLVNPECETSATAESFVIDFPVTDTVNGLGFLVVHSIRILASPHP